jgi:hypothetical protein
MACAAAMPGSPLLARPWRCAVSPARSILRWTPAARPAFTTNSTCGRRTLVAVHPLAAGRRDGPRPASASRTSGALGESIGARGPRTNGLGRGSIFLSLPHVRCDRWAGRSRQMTERGATCMTHATTPDRRLPIARLPRYVPGEWRCLDCGRLAYGHSDRPRCPACFSPRLTSTTAPQARAANGR